MTTINGINVEVPACKNGAASVVANRLPQYESADLRAYVAQANSIQPDLVYSLVLHGDVLTLNGAGRSTFNSTPIQVSPNYQKAFKEAVIKLTACSHDNKYNQVTDALAAAIPFVRAASTRDATANVAAK